MAELQRSAMSFRRQGSSGQVFDDKFLLELNKITQQQQQQNDDDDDNFNPLQQEEDEIKPRVSVGSIGVIDRSRSDGGGRAFRTGKVPIADEPPSPRLSACGICSALGKGEKGGRRPKSSKRRK